MEVNWDEFLNGKIAFRVDRACFEAFANECNRRGVFFRGGGVRVSDVNPFSPSYILIHGKRLEHVLYRCLLPGCMAEFCKIIMYTGTDCDRDVYMKKYFNDIPIITLKINETGKLEV